jgi:hypothetical protein
VKRALKNFFRINLIKALGLSQQVQMMRFTGENWQLFGPIIDGHAE